MVEIKIAEWNGLAGGGYAEKRKYYEHDKAYKMKVHRGLRDILARNKLDIGLENVNQNLEKYEGVEISWAKDSLFSGANDVKLYVDFPEDLGEEDLEDFQHELLSAVEKSLNQTEDDSAVTS